MDQPKSNGKTDALERGVFARFLFGDFGLPMTFWLLGVLPAQAFNYLIGLITTPWPWLILASLCLVHAYMISIAVWNAATKYKGKKMWAVLAKIMAVLNVIKWSIALPGYIAAFSMAAKLV